MLQRWWLALVVAGAFVSAAWAQDIFVTPIPNEPFSGVIEVQRTVVQPNGAAMALKTTRLIARDSQGRVHNERRMLMPVMNPGIPQVLTCILTIRRHGYRRYWMSRRRCTGRWW